MCAAAEAKTALDAALGDNASLVSEELAPLVTSLLELNQGHIFKEWPALGTADDDKRRLLAQLSHLDANYSDGGLPGYVRNARRLLEAAAKGANPFEGLSPEVPDGVSLDYCSAEFRRLETLGADAAAGAVASADEGGGGDDGGVGGAGFVLVAGGLGERLGFSGIKLSLPSDTARGACFLQDYCHSILALQRRRRNKKNSLLLPLAIMTSPDTHEKTLSLLKSNDYFGMQESQVTLMLQERVACLADGDASLALDPNDPFQILTKPHGHGDVHALMHSTGTARRWQREHGTEWVCFFQDTNVQAFRALPAAVGVAREKKYAMCSVAVPRRAGEAIGALARLVPKDKNTSEKNNSGESSSSPSLTINVEYNQLDPLLRATERFAGGDADDPSTGFSPFPGNINQLVVSMDAYLKALDKSAGVVGEFVNPKYKDATTRTSFKSPARLECMMQDLPHALDATRDLVGFLTVNQVWAAYSPVKNSLAEAAAKAGKGEPTHSAAAAEFDSYRANCFMLSSLGARVGGGGGGGGGGEGNDDNNGPKRATFKGVPVSLWPAVTWSPLFALTLDDLEGRVRGSNVVISPGSSLVVRLPVAAAAADDDSSPSSSPSFSVGSVSIQGLDLDGALDVEVLPGCSLRIAGGGGGSSSSSPAAALVRNGGWRFVELDDAKPAPEELRIRGFKVCKRGGSGGGEKVLIDSPGEHEWSGNVGGGGAGGGGAGAEEKAEEEEKEVAAVA